MERDQERQSRQNKAQYEHCPGYSDKHGIWNNGFNCPRWGGPNDEYCCENERESFCCPPPQQQHNDEPLNTTPHKGNNNIMIIYPDRMSPPVVTVPVLMIATGAGIVLAIIVVIATVCLCCFFCRCCRNQKSRLFKSNKKVDLMNMEAAKISSAIENQAMTSSRPRTPSSVHNMTTSRIIDISNIKESRFSFSTEEDHHAMNVDAPGMIQVGKWSGDSMKKSMRDLDFINLPPISDERETNNFYNDNFRMHDSIMTTSDYHSSSPLTGQPNNNTNNTNNQHNNINSNGSNSATLGRHQHHRQRCHHLHHSSASSCLNPSQQQQLAGIQSQGAMKRLTFDLLHSLSPGLQRH